MEHIVSEKDITLWKSYWKKIANNTLDDISDEEIDCVSDLLNQWLEKDTGEEYNCFKEDTRVSPPNLNKAFQHLWNDVRNALLVNPKNTIFGELENGGRYYGPLVRCEREDYPEVEKFAKKGNPIAFKRKYASWSTSTLYIQDFLLDCSYVLLSHAGYMNIEECSKSEKDKDFAIDIYAIYDVLLRHNLIAEIDVNREEHEMIYQIDPDYTVIAAVCFQPYEF